MTSRRAEQLPKEADDAPSDRYKDVEQATQDDEGTGRNGNHGADFVSPISVARTSKPTQPRRRHETAERSHPNMDTDVCSVRVDSAVAKSPYDAAWLRTSV